MLAYAALVTGSDNETAENEISGNLYALGIQTILIMVPNPDRASGISTLSVGGSGNDDWLSCHLRDCAYRGAELMFRSQRLAQAETTILSRLMRPLLGVRTVTLGTAEAHAFKPLLLAEGFRAVIENAPKRLAAIAICDESNLGKEPHLLAALQRRREDQKLPGPVSMLLGVLGVGQYRVRLLATNLVLDFLL